MGNMGILVFIIVVDIKAKAPFQVKDDSYVELSSAGIVERNDAVHIGEP
jgi:hypothetical protein